MPQKTDNFKVMDAKELKAELVKLEEKIRLIKFRAEGSKSKNVKESATLRKQIAKIFTELNKNNQRDSKKQ